jgi:hypothetical protein
MIELLLPCGFYTLEYSWVKATIAICTPADYSVAKNASSGYLNGDVSIFVVLNFRNKSCVLGAHIALFSKFMFMFLLNYHLACLSMFTLYILAPSL